MHHNDDPTIIKLMNPDIAGSKIHPARAHLKPLSFNTGCQKKRGEQETLHLLKPKASKSSTPSLSFINHGELHFLDKQQWRCNQQSTMIRWMYSDGCIRFDYKPNGWMSMLTLRIV